MKKNKLNAFTELCKSKNWPNIINYLENTDFDVNLDFAIYTAALIEIYCPDENIKSAYGIPLLDRLMEIRAFEQEDSCTRSNFLGNLINVYNLYAAYVLATQENLGLQDGKIALTIQNYVKKNKIKLTDELDYHNMEMYPEIKKRIFKTFGDFTLDENEKKQKETYKRCNRIKYGAKRELLETTAKPSLEAKNQISKEVERILNLPSNTCNVEGEFESRSRFNNAQFISIRLKPTPTLEIMQGYADILKECGLEVKISENETTIYDTYCLDRKIDIKGTAVEIYKQIQELMRYKSGTMVEKVEDEVTKKTNIIVLEKKENLEGSANIDIVVPQEKNKVTTKKVNDNKIQRPEVTTTPLSNFCKIHGLFPVVLAGAALIGTEIYKQMYLSK